LLLFLVLAGAGLAIGRLRCTAAGAAGGGAAGVPVGASTST
jgi:hypothetical protein